MLKVYLLDMLKFAILPLALTASLSANAANNVVFSCSVKGGKLVKVTKVGSSYQYSFGIPNKPELVFRNTKAEVVDQSPKWDGQGRYMWTGMLMKNGDYSYRVAIYMDRITEEHEVTSNLEVFKGDELLSTFNCIGKAFVNWDDEFMW